MKYIILLIYLISSGLNNSNSCYIEDSDYTFILPEGFEVINTLERNGVLTVTDQYENGLDIYIDSKNVYPDKDLEICLLKREWEDHIIDEQELPDGGYLIHIETQSVIDPITTIMIFPKQSFVVKAFLMKLGDSQTHAAFEEKAMKLVRSIARGGTYEKAWIDCISSFVNTFGLL